MRKTLRINILDIRDGNVHIAGVLFNFHAGSEVIKAADEKGSSVEICPVRAPALDTAADSSKPAREAFFYELSLPLHAGASYRFLCTQKGSDSVLTLKFGKLSRLTNIEGSFFIAGNYAVCSSGDSIKVFSAGILTRPKLSRRWEHSIMREASPDIMKLRSEAMALKKKSKPIWLISDRSDSAGDNGEALFEYLMNDPNETHAKDRYDIRFVISSSSPDLERVMKTGPVVEAGSETHRLLYAASSMVISSAADEWIRNPLAEKRKYFCDFLDTRFVFLQHGVIKDDLSGWLHKAKKNFDIFITSSPAEWRSVCEGNYGYDSSVVKLTGLARFDKLNDSSEKKISILPTWRKYAASDIIKGSSERPYSETFRDTEYFRFYNELINDPRLTGAMKEHGYRGVFYLHPNHMKQGRDFTGNDTISVWDDIVPFNRVFCESSLLVTDFSSVAIDFAYLGKPVVYTQFDKEKFFSTHSYVQGYYDYERDGFGPVCYDLDSAVDTIVDIIKNGCAEPDTYRERVDEFFAFRDRSNCHRIYEELLKL
ncbi:MAG: CDP-glycerol glycerophosphotransferase family protein [Mogibacterium sp.]|nr:CDP-glycerol glycerophosphotransferase family protein [Mogibacterium sp.]